MPRRYRRNSHYGDGLRIPMDRERRAVWRARLHMFRRGRKITPLYEDIGLAMLRRLGANGRLDPSHDSVADDVGCSSRSVRRALSAFHVCGLMHWVNRIVRDGWAVRQTSNAYALALPAVGNISTIPAFGCGGQNGRETRPLYNKGLSFLSNVKSAREGLAVIAGARMQALGLG